MSCVLSREKKLHLIWKLTWIKYKGKMSDCCTFLGMIGHGLPGIVTQATRATPVVLNGLVLGARLHLDSDQSMS